MSNHFIPLQQAVDMTKLYRLNQPSSLSISETFDLSAIKSLIANPLAASLRIYYGMSTTGKIHAILLVADAAGNDILPSSMSFVAGDPNQIVEDGITCPPICPPPSLLNS